LRGGVYVASKTECAPMWRLLREYGARINSTWIDEAEVGQTADASELWERVIREVSQCDRVVVYARHRDNLTGALVEVGAALAFGKPVYLLGTCPQFHKRCSFTKHPLVRRAWDFVEAFGEHA
jgi:nucleoside 2-deoxyribosyltransferase